MTDLCLVDPLRDMRNIAAMCDSEAYPALEAWLDRWQLAEEGGPTMGDLLGDPEWDKREIRLAMIRLRANISHEYASKAKTLTWHANQMRNEVADFGRIIAKKWTPTSPRSRRTPRRAPSSWRPGSMRSLPAGVSLSLGDPASS